MIQLALAISLLFPAQSARERTPERIQIIRSEVGPKGATKGDTFVFDEQRDSFDLAADKEVIVAFEWEAAPGNHRCELSWIAPDGTVALKAMLDLPAKGRRFSGYWSLLLNPTMARGLWAAEVKVNGIPAGSRTFRIQGPPIARPLPPDELYKLAPRMDKEDWFPEAQFRALAQQGLLGATIPNEYGGAGLDVLAQCFISEAVAYWNHGLSASILASDNLCAHNLVRNANDEQKQRYLPRFADGRAIGALGMTEPGAGSDALGSMATIARRDGDDYVLNGRKLFITNGPVADVLLVYAKTAPDKKQHGISAFIVESRCAGFRVAQKLDKMGWRGSPTGELVFDECRVPAANLLGVDQ